MAEPAPDVNLAQWALGLVATGALAVATWIWTRIAGIETRLDQRLDRHETAAKAATDAARAATSIEIRDLWQAVTEDRRNTAGFRERMLERMADVSTKADLQNLKADIRAMLEQHK